MSDPKGSNDDSSKNIEGYVFAFGFHIHEISSLISLDGTSYVERSLNAQNKIHGRKR